MINLFNSLDGRKLLIPHITCGDPDLETSKSLICGMAGSGADAVILGIPFSDPIAESEIITSSSVRAYDAGVNLDKIFDMIEDVRGLNDVPLILATYANVAFNGGVDNFAKRIKAAGIDGLIVYDAPNEEKDEFATPCSRHGICYISQAATSFIDRAKAAAKDAEGFMYCLTADNLSYKDACFVKDIKKVKDIPCLFAFDNPDIGTVKAAVEICDGIIVESGVVRIIQSLGDVCLQGVNDYIRTLKSALNG